MSLTLDDLVAMPGPELHAIMDAAHPFDPDAIAGRQFLGSDLSMGRIGRGILWQTFRKLFVHDERDGHVRGWNVRMEQHGLHGPRVPMRRRNGEEKSFAHYRVRESHGIDWPRGWQGTQFLDYTTVGNTIVDRWGYTPLVAVNEGSSELLLGWEVFRVGSRFVAPSMYWAIQADGPVETVVPPR